MTDALLDAILAAPDDDAPRLVWADREGGERGELVVIQCALADPTLDPKQRARLAERAERIIGRLDVWGPGVFIEPTFTRGFVEQLSLPLALFLKHLPVLIERAPLLRTLELKDCAASVSRRGRSAEEVWRSVEAQLVWVFDRLPRGRILSLTIEPVVETRGEGLEANKVERQYFGDSLLQLVSTTPSLEQLRALHLPGAMLTRGSLVHLRRLEDLDELGARAGGDLLMDELRSLREAGR